MATPSETRDLSTDGFRPDDVPEHAPLAGTAVGEDVVVVRDGDGFAALAGTCTHLGAPLSGARVDDGCLVCPWHHARFEAGTGLASGPAFEALARYEVVEPTPGTDVFHVGRALEAESPAAQQQPEGPVVVVGGGAAGFACVQRLRERGVRTPVVLLTADDVPYDRTHLSKAALAGGKPLDSLPLVPLSWYAENDVTLRTGATVRAVDAEARTVTLAGGSTQQFGALLLAPGSEPNRLPVPGADDPGLVHVIRTTADVEALTDGLAGGLRAVVVGSSFIGMEAASSLRQRGLVVEVVSPDAVPLEAVLGTDLGARLREVHESEGVVFHLGRSLASVQTGERADGSGTSATLDDGTVLGCDLVVMGVGVSPRYDLFEGLGVDVAHGVQVDEQLRVAGVDGVFAAGDVAAAPVLGEPTRIEHWATAVRHGQTVADVLAGVPGAAVDPVPYFWSGQFDLKLRYTGHSSAFDRTVVVGDLDALEASVFYLEGEDVRAVASIGRDAENLAVDAAMRAGDAGALRELAGLSR